MCDICHDTGFELRGNDASYCSCVKGQNMKAAHHRDPEFKPKRAKARGYVGGRDRQYSDADEDAPSGG